MTFDEILAQVLALLQREKGVSYRALKLRFAINDDYIEGLKDELIYAKKLAVDEENRVLVWTGDTTNGQAGAPQPARPTPQPAIQAPSPPDERPSAAPRTLEAERRQLTVIFCDLVDSMVSYFNCTTGNVSHSVKDHTWSARPAAIAGVRFCHQPSV